MLVISFFQLTTKNFNLKMKKFKDIITSFGTKIMKIKKKYKEKNNLFFTLILLFY